MISPWRHERATANWRMPTPKQMEMLAAAADRKIAARLLGPGIRLAVNAPAT
jgi:hypothetical protein